MWTSSVTLLTSTARIVIERERRHQHRFVSIWLSYAEFQGDGVKRLILLNGARQAA